MWPIPERIRRPVYSCFIVTNLFAIGYCNLPHSVGGGISSDMRMFQDHFYVEAANANTAHDYGVAYLGWQGVQQLHGSLSWLDRKIRTYAHYVGLDNRWQMFGRQSRFNWWYVIKGRYRDGSREEEIVLDLPRQSEQSGVPRTPLQYHFLDFREGKFHLNMYREPYDRAAYARYLARKFPTHDGMPIESIAFELHYQNLNTPDEARATGTHLQPETHHFIYNRFQADGILEQERTIYSLPAIGNSQVTREADDTVNGRLGARSVNAEQ